MPILTLLETAGTQCGNCLPTLIAALGKDEPKHLLQLASLCHWHSTCVLSKLELVVMQSYELTYALHHLSLLRGI